MKLLKLILIFSGVLTIHASFGQKALKWENDFETAKHIAKEFDKPMILLFSGSDWCKPCIKLKTYILESDEFIDYSSKFVLYNADFPYRIKQSKALKKQNEELAEKYNPKGEFPKVVYIDKDGKPLGSTGLIDCSPADYIQKIEEILQP